MDVLSVILVIEATIIGLFLFLLVVGNILGLADKKLNPNYPHCDIDPRCHIAFAWGKDGNGWIGNHLVVHNRALKKERKFARKPTTVR